VSQPRLHPRASVALVGLILAALVAACGGSGSSASVAPSASGPAAAPSASTGAAASASAAPSASADPSGPLTKLTVGLGYIPSVQFAQFYLAQQKGYYAAAGLEVTFQNKIDPDLIRLVGQGAIDIGIGDGTSVIPAVSQGIPVRYVATIYGQFPNIVFAKASSGIKTAADLKGRKIGTPGRYGSSWIMLQALLSSVHLTTNDVEIVEYPDFTQGAAVAAGAVDAATGFSNNEPVQLQLGGDTPVILHVDDVVALPGPGLIAGVATLDAKHDAIAAFVAATLQAMNEITKDPTAGLDAAIAAVPDLASARDTQAAILAATIAAWPGPVQVAHGLGAIDVDGWTASIPVLAGMDLVPNPVTTEDLVRTDVLPAGD
jgi:NitT/TauT family transport system substrate-binding protein